MGILQVKLYERPRVRKSVINKVYIFHSLGNRRLEVEEAYINLILGQIILIIVSSLTNVRKQNSRINYARLH